MNRYVLPLLLSSLTVSAASFAEGASQPANSLDVYAGVQGGAEFLTIKKEGAISTADNNILQNN